MSSYNRVMSYVVGLPIAIAGSVWMWKRLNLKMFSAEKEINVAIITRSKENYKLKNKTLALLYKDIDLNDIERHTFMLKRLFDSAQHSIHLAMYIFTNRILGEALVFAKQRGVKVCVIFEKSMENSTNSQVRHFSNAFVEYRIEVRRTMHHKFCLIDVPHERNTWEEDTERDDSLFPIPKNGLLVTGSLNYTQEALFNNHENLIVTSNKEIVDTFMENFYVLWDELNPAHDKVVYYQ